MIGKKDLLYFLAFLLLFGFLFQKFILTDTTFFVRDITRLEIPSRLLCAQLLKEGDFALWTDAFGNGQPFLANPKNAVFYPTTWLYLILPFFLAFKLHYVIHIGAAYLGIYYLGRSYALSRAASFLAASLFLTGGPYLSSLEFYNHIAALAWLPWILLGQRISFRLSPLRIIVPAVFWTLALLSGSPEILFITILLSLLQVFFLSQRKSRGVAQFLLLFVLSILISSVQIVPTLEYWRTSVRRSVQTVEWPLEAVQLLNIPFPHILGNDREPGRQDFWAGEFFDRGNPLHYSLYIGFGPLLLLFFSFRKSSRRLAQFLAFSTALFLLLSLGRYSMLYPVILKIPILASIFYPVKFIIGSVFSLSLLAAIGFDHLFHSERTPKKRMSWLFTGSALSFIAFILCREQVVQFFRRLFVITTEDSAKELQRSFWHGLGFLMLTATVLFLAALPKRPFRPASFVFLAVLAADLAYHNRSINPVIPADFFREPSVLGEVIKPTRIHREESVPDELRPAFRTAEGAVRYFRRSLYPFCGIGEGIRYLYNEDSYLFYSSEYHALLQSIAGGGRGELMKILRAQGCEYFIGHTPLPGLPYQTVNIQGYPLYVQEIDGRVPPAYIVHHAAEAHSFKKALAILESEGFDPRNTAILNSRSPFPTDDNLTDAGNEVLFTIKDSSSEKQFSILISRPGLLIIPGNSAPGWKAWVDGRPAAVLEACPASRAILIPPGKHRVSLKYRPRSFIMGGLVTIISLIGLGLYLVISLSKGRANSEPEAGPISPVNSR
jgi:hypothetical protein